MAEQTAPDGVLTLIKEEHYDKALNFFRYDLLATEYISRAIDFKWNPEVEEMCLTALQRNISLMLLDKETGDVMGVRVMTVSKAGDSLSEDQFQDPGMKTIVGFWKYGDEKTRFFETYNVKEAIHFFGLGVGVKYRNRGLGTFLVDVSLKFLKNLNISPLYIKAEASSPYSVRIFEKLGFDLLAEVKYDDYLRDGQIAIKSSEDNKAMKTYVKVV